MDNESLKQADALFFERHKADKALFNAVTGKPRQLTMGMADQALRKEWLSIYREVKDVRLKGFTACDVGSVVTACPAVSAPVVAKPSAKVSLANVLKNYQTPDEALQEWSPYGLGYTGGEKTLITPTEGALLDELGRWRPDKLLKFKAIRNEAFAAANAEFPVPSGWTRSAQDWANLGHNDAFRHTYWNARLTQEFGEDWTRRFTTAHEGVPGNEDFREAQDLYNNEQGRHIGDANPTASAAQTQKLVREAVDNGDVVVVDKTKNLQWSNDVPVGDHYVAP